MQGLYVAETADALVKGGWLVRSINDELVGKTTEDPVELALFIGPRAEERAKDYSAGLERGHLRIIPGGRAVTPTEAPIPTLEIPAVH